MEEYNHIIVLEVKRTARQSTSTIYVPVNIRHWFRFWCFNCIKLKMEEGWPFRWPLSIELCLEHNLMNDPGVRGWWGEPGLTPWTHQPMRPFSIIWNHVSKDAASIWEAFFFPIQPWLGGTWTMTSGSLTQKEIRTKLNLISRRGKWLGSGTKTILKLLVGKKWRTKAKYTL